MTETEQTLWFAVVDLAGEQLRYIGASDGEAVKVWTRGTVHGRGLSKLSAIVDARVNAVRVRRGLEAAARRLQNVRS